MITGWSEIDFFRTIADALRLHIGVLQTPFQRDEFLAAVRATSVSHQLPEKSGDREAWQSRYLLRVSL